MQGLLPVLCFIAGFALAWLVLRRHRHDTETVLRDLSADALSRNQQSFADLAKSTLAPVRESLDKVDSKIQDLEKARVGAYATLTEQVRGLLETQSQLRAETGNLGDGIAESRRTRPVGRNAVAPGGGDGRHARSLRLLRPDLDCV